MNTKKRLVSDELWRIVEPLLPIEPSKRGAVAPADSANKGATPVWSKGWQENTANRSGPERLNVACCQS
jgi:transposase